jgi:hypothetical protein
MAVVQTHIAIVQEFWLVKDVIRGLGSCGKIFKAYNVNKTRACIITKGADAALLPQLSSCDLTAVPPRLKFAK